MMSLNKLITLTIIFSFLIPIGAGHGIGVIGLIEIVGIGEIFEPGKRLSLTGNYDDRLITAAPFALIGQIILLVAIFLNLNIRKRMAIYAGLLFTFFAYFILIINFTRSSLDRFSFWGGILFLVFAIMLLVRVIAFRRNVES